MIPIYGLVFFLAFGCALTSDVLKFTDANFDSEIGSYAVVLVKFYAPWCGHCKRLAPAFEAAARTLKANGHQVFLADVDCTVETATCSKHGVSGYPTLKVFSKNKDATEYNGPRDEDGIVNHMIALVAPPSIEIHDSSELSKLCATQQPVIAGFFVDSKLQKIFDEVADALRFTFKFTHTFNEELMKKESAKDSIRVYLPTSWKSKFEEPFQIYTGALKTSDLKDWIESNAFGMCGIRTPENTKHFTAGSMVKIYSAVDFDKNAKMIAYYRNRALRALKAKHAEGHVLGCSMGDKMKFYGELSGYGFEDDSASDKVRVAITTKAGKKYVMKEDFSSDSFTAFLDQYFAGSLTPYMKSEDIPATQEGHTVKVVAKNYDELVTNADKDVLIAFVASWCGHCKSMKPKYEELAKKLKDEPNVVIAMMDANANDVPEMFSVSGFPTLYWLAKNSKDAPTPYQGGRETDDFLQYIAKEATTELVGFDRKGNVKKSEL